MKQCIVFILSLAVIATSLKDVVTYVDYYVNQDYIVKNLCVNRFEPKKKCNGKCHLSKNLEENHKESSENPPLTQEENRTFYIPAINIVPSLPTIIEWAENKPIAYLNTLYKLEYQTDIFHPPCILA